MIGLGFQLQTTDIELHQLFEAAENLNIEPITYSLIPFSDEILGIEEAERYDIIGLFGSIKTVSLYNSGKFPANFHLDYDAVKFDQRYYKHVLKQHLVNYDCDISTYGCVADQPVSEYTFCKPTSDLKSFAGIVLEPGQTLREELSKTQSNVADDTPVLLSPWRKIQEEFRLHVVDGEVIDCSRYRKNQQLSVEHVGLLPDLLWYHSVISEIYRPADNYVIDIARMANGSLSVMEYNCINCSGWYKSDKTKILQAYIAYLTKVRNERHNI